jgi:hypothetical protein
MGTGKIHAVAKDSAFSERDEAYSKSFLKLFELFALIVKLAK